jgi:L-rhamnose mutarotase
MPERIAFRMMLNPGQAEEYRQRHDEIWPQMLAALREAGISDYSIWLDPETNHLFATLVRADDHAMDDLPHTEINRRWWDFMADIIR